MSLTSSRTRFAGIAVASTLALGISGCQLLLNDKSGSGGTGTSSKAATGTSSTKASTTGTNATSTTKASTGTGTGTTTTTGTTTGTASTGSLMSTCAIAPTAAACNEASPFVCPQPKVTCGGDPRCDAYCTVITGRCTGGNKQYGDDAECCALCAAIVGNTSDKSTLCCRTQGLTNSSLNDSEACTNGGPFGTLDSSPNTTCGSQGIQVCGLVEHACSNSNPPTGCTAACINNFGNASTNAYQAGDTGQSISGAMTFALRALAATDQTQRQMDCNAAYAIVCPTLVSGG